MKKLITAALLTLGLTACIPPNEPLLSTEHQDYSTVTAVGNCTQYKRHMVCWVKTDQRDYERYQMNNWPGLHINIGDKLGVTYKVYQTYVESYNTRSTSDMMMYRWRCSKTDPDCYWPSKNQ